MKGVHQTCALREIHGLDGDVERLFSLVFIIIIFFLPGNFTCQGIVAY